MRRMGVWEMCEGWRMVAREVMVCAINKSQTYVTFELDKWHMCNKSLYYLTTISHIGIAPTLMKLIIWTYQLCPMYHKILKTF